MNANNFNNIFNAIMAEKNWISEQLIKRIGIKKCVFLHVFK